MGRPVSEEWSHGRVWKFEKMVLRKYGNMEGEEEVEGRDVKSSAYNEKTHGRKRLTGKKEYVKIEGKRINERYRKWIWKENFVERKRHRGMDRKDSALKGRGAVEKRIYGKSKGRGVTIHRK